MQFLLELQCLFDDLVDFLEFFRLRHKKSDMVKHELRVTSYELKV